MWPRRSRDLVPSSSIVPSVRLQHSSRGMASPAVWGVLHPAGPRSGPHRVQPCRPGPAHHHALRPVNQTAWSAPQPGVPGGACACGLEPPTMRVRVAWSIPHVCGLEPPPCVCVWLGAFPAVRVRAACAGCIWPFFLQSLRMQKSEVDLMKTKLRRLEEEKSRKDRQIEQLLDPSRVSLARPGPAAHRTARRGRRGPHRPLSRLTPLPTGPGFCPDSGGGQA